MSIQSQALGMSLSGIAPSEVAGAKAFVERMDADESGSLHKQAAVIAASLFHAAGKEASASYHLYHDIISDPWNPGYQVFTDAASDVITRELEKDASEVLATKSATQIAKKIPGMVALGSGGLKSLILLALSTGAVGGTLYNTVDRATGQDDVAAEELKARKNRYQELTGEIERELQDRGISPEQAVKNVTTTFE